MKYILSVLLVVSSVVSLYAAEQSRPNILWIKIEDWSPSLSCYGTKGIQTPNVDKLASEGIRYERAFSTAPVCSPSRSAMMTGFHQNYIGAHQHRTDEKKPLPYGIRPIPHLLADAGYYTCLMSSKTDCNFLPSTKKELFMGADWKDRAPDQPHEHVRWQLYCVQTICRLAPRPSAWLIYRCRLSACQRGHCCLASRNAHFP